MHESGLPIATAPVPTVQVRNSCAALGTLTILGVHRVLEHAFVHVHCALPRPAGRPGPTGRRDEVQRTSRASDETTTIWVHTFLEAKMNGDSE